MISWSLIAQEAPKAPNLWVWMDSSDGSIGMISILFWALIYAAILGWLAVIISYALAPPDARMLWSSRMPGFNKVLGL